MIGGIMSIQTAMDLIVAGFSLMIGFGFFALIASVLCSVAFFHHLKASPSDPTVFNFWPEINNSKPESNMVGETRNEDFSTTCTRNAV